MVMDTHTEEIQQRDRLEKIQTYRLVRDIVLEQQKQQALSQKEPIRGLVEMCENMQVSRDRERPV